MLVCCRSELVSETSRSSDVLALPDPRARKGVPVQPVPHPQTTHRDRPRALPHRASDQDLVPEPPHEVQKGDPAYQGAERLVLRRRGWSARSRRPQGPSRTCALGRFYHRPWSGKQDCSNTLAPSYIYRAVVLCCSCLYFISFPPSVAAITICGETHRLRDALRCLPCENYSYSGRRTSQCIPRLSFIKMC